MTSEDVLRTRVSRIAKSSAREFLAKFEILGNVGLGVWHWGLHLEGTLLSVITFGTTCFGGRRGWIADLAAGYGLRIFQVCRGGTLPGARKGIPSRAIALSCRAMREHHGPFVAVAYADEALGEIGTIYQASGAVYTGTTDPKGQADYIVNGRKRSAWQVRKCYGTRDRKALKRIDPTVKVIPLRPKHRYLFIGADGGTRRQILDSIQAYSRPYPKRSGLESAVPFSYGHHMESEVAGVL